MLLQDPGHGLENPCPDVCVPRRGYMVPSSIQNLLRLLSFPIDAADKIVHNDLKPWDRVFHGEVFSGRGHEYENLVGLCLLRVRVCVHGCGDVQRPCGGDV